MEWRCYETRVMYGLKKVVSLILDVYKDFGLKQYSFRLSLRDKEDKEKD